VKKIPQETIAESCRTVRGSMVAGILHFIGRWMARLSPQGHVHCRKETGFARYSDQRPQVR